MIVGNGYSSEGQPMSIASHRQRNRMPLPTVEENGYYSEGGPGMRMRHNMSRQGGAGGSVSGGGSVYNVGHHQVNQVLVIRCRITKFLALQTLYANVFAQIGRNV